MKKLVTILTLVSMGWACQSAQVQPSNEVEAKVLGVVPVPVGRQCVAFRLQINGQQYATDGIPAPYTQPGTLVKITYQQNAACEPPTASDGPYVIKLTSIHQ